MGDATLPERIANRLRRDILRGELLPGDQIKERDLAARMEASRTPIREAIRILAKQGLIELRPARSPIVADPSFEELRDAIEVLQALELLSGRMACERATKTEIAKIRALHEELSEKYDSIDTLDSFEIDMRFHRAIALAAHNEPLAEMHQTMLERLWHARYMSASQRRARDRVRSQHGNIVEALESGDAARMRTELEAHLSAMVENIQWQFERNLAQREAAKRPRNNDTQTQK